MKDGLRALGAAAQTWSDLTPSQTERFLAAFRGALYPVRTLVATPYRGDHAVFFVAEGLVRFYTLGEDGDEATQHFADSGDFVRAVTALRNNQPYGAQALETSLVFSVPGAAWEKLTADDPAYGRFAQGLAEAMLALKTRRIHALQTLDAAGRYEDFLHRFPRMAGRIPQYHVASYLGITEVTLSRTKGRLPRSV